MANRRNIDAGEDQEQETTYAPEAYAPLDPSTAGRWFVLEGQALVWTDDQSGAGVAWAKQTSENQRLWQHFQLAKKMNLPAGVAYQLAVNSVDGVSEEFGDLEEAQSIFTSLLTDG